jgi:hypothetical protein
MVVLLINGREKGRNVSKKIIRFVARLLSLGFFVAGIFGPAMAQEPAKASVKVLLKNDKVKVVEATIPVGAEGPNMARPYRIGRALTDGTMERTYPDGKKEIIRWKAGEVKALGPDPKYKPRNIGKTDFRIYVVEMK